MHLLLLVAFLFGALNLPINEAKAQASIGQTEVLAFSRNQYAAGAQNWAITQDKNRRLYFANNEGLLVFNGQNWQRFPIPNNTILRSIAFGPDGKLYAGAQDELGYFAPSQAGLLTFTSLKPQLPERNRSFPDVWNIVVTDEGVFFRTSKVIFRLHNQKFTSKQSSTLWLSLHKHQGKAIAHDKNFGLLKWHQNRWQTVIASTTLPEDFRITDMAALNRDSSVLTTEKHGLFILANNRLLPLAVTGSNFEQKQHLTAVTVLGDKSILVGTYLNGLYHLSAQGTVLENISHRQGLRNNTVRSLFADEKSNVWAGLDNGLAFFEYYTAIRHINPPSFSHGVGYSVQKSGDDLYFALSTGILYLPVKNRDDFGTIKESPQPILNGLSWKLTSIQNQLLACKDDGLWLIRNHTATPVSKSTGFWSPRLTSGNWPGKMVVGSYLGLHFFNPSSTGLTDAGQLPDFDESARFVETDHQNTWVSHPYRGIYRIHAASKRIYHYDQRKGLPSNLNNHVFRLQEQIVFATEKGIYEYDAKQDRMHKSKKYERLFGDLPIRYLSEDDKGNAWFVQNNWVGFANLNSAKSELHYIPELSNKIVSGFENIFPYNSRNVLIGSDEGFYHLNFDQYIKKIRAFDAYLTRIKTIGEVDSTLYGGFRLGKQSNNDVHNIPYDFNSLQFSFAASLFEPSSPLEFNFYLEGFESTWNGWTTKADKDYTNLPPGKYTFHLKARRSPSHESTHFRYLLFINPPFYRTIWAYGLYSLLTVGFLFALMKLQTKRYRKRQNVRRAADKKRFEEKQQQMAYKHQLDLEQSEKEFIRLQKEKLEGEIEHKNAELATATMNLVQKKEFILKLRTELSHLQKNQQTSSESPELKKLLKTLAEEEKLNKEWDHFAQHFNSVHSNFLTILKSKFPLLKPHELQLCAYLRMNLSSKDIAPLMSISVRGVEISRYRLRKKLTLSTEENLVQFLMDLR